MSIEERRVSMKIAVAVGLRSWEKEEIHFIFLTDIRLKKIDIRQKNK